jgi:hypothetical protein
MSGDADLLAPVTEQPPPVADAAPPVAPPVEAKTDDEPEVIEIPTGEKLVQLSALTSAREKTKTVRAELEAAKAEIGKSAEKDTRIAALEQQLQQLTPMAQAYQAALQAQQLQPQKPAEPTPEQNAKLQRVAQQLDFYKSDGTLDLTRAQSHLDLLREEAAEIARQQVEPFQAQTTSDKSSFNLQRALITRTPTGAQPDPEVLRQVWQRLDPKITSTPEGAAQAFSVALGHSLLLGKTTSKAAEVIPDPLVTERAGGKDAPPETALRESDRRIARDLGLTDKEYAAELGKMPQGWGKGA